MPHGRPPISTTTRLYGHFAYATVQRPMSAPAVMNALLERRGVDALFVPLQVPPEHLAATIAGMRHLRDFAGFCVTMPHKGPKPTLVSPAAKSPWVAVTSTSAK